MRRLKPAAERRIAELAADINETGKPAIGIMKSSPKFESDFGKSGEQ
jgi:hypothetical protein